MFPIRYLLVCLGVLLIVGCSTDSGFPTTYPVAGTVKYKGKPIAGATVTFYLSDGKGSAVGSSGPDGSFTLSSFRPGDGAVAGNYKVSIAKYAATQPEKTDTPPEGEIASGDIDPANYAPPTASSLNQRPAAPKNDLPPKYAQADSSGLTASVSESGKNQFDFDLK